MVYTFRYPWSARVNWFSHSPFAPGMSWVELLLAAGAILGVVLLVLLIIALRRSARRPRPNRGADRLDVWRKRRTDLLEERRRILGMVQAGKVSPGDGDRLLEALETEASRASCPYCGEMIRADAVKCRYCGTFLNAPAAAASPRLTKSRDKVLCGVCGGLAGYLNIDPTLVRLGLILLALFSFFWPTVIAYVVMAVILPPAEAPRAS